LNDLLVLGILERGEHHEILFMVTQLPYPLNILICEQDIVPAALTAPLADKAFPLHDSNSAVTVFKISENPAPAKPTGLLQACSLNP
jgi:hypothetical protein